MPSSSQRQRRPLSFLPLLVAGLGGIVAAHAISKDTRSLLPLVGLSVLFLLPALVGRWRMRRLLMSGDVERVIGMWRGSIERVPHAETMAPLLQATAYASYGWNQAARKALDRAVKGPAWDAAIEQRLFVETLLDTFEGEREAAMRKAQVLSTLPVPSAGVLARRRLMLLRRGLGALARAFAHSSREGDAALLSKAAGASPLVHWAMRYASAVLAIDRGRLGDVQPLLAGAPAWPADSAFFNYHHELLERARV